MQSTDKQRNFAFILLAKAGYSTKYMDARFRALGAGMKERSGSVDGWLKNMSVGEISKLIDHLKGEDNG